MTTPASTSRTRTRKPRVITVTSEPISKTPKTKRGRSKKTVLQQLEEQAERERYELHLLRDIAALRLPNPERHVLWHPTVDYEADLLYSRERLIIEVDGGTYIPYGHHNFGDGYEYDRIRDAEALTLGYTILRVTTKMVESGTAADYVERVLHAVWARNGRQQRTA